VLEARSTWCETNLSAVVSWENQRYFGYGRMEKPGFHVESKRRQSFRLHSVDESTVA